MLRDGKLHLGQRIRGLQALVDQIQRRPQTAQYALLSRASQVRILPGALDNPRICWAVAVASLLILLCRIHRQVADCDRVAVPCGRLGHCLNGAQMSRYRRNVMVRCTAKAANIR